MLRVYTYSVLTVTNDVCYPTDDNLHIFLPFFPKSSVVVVVVVFQFERMSTFPSKHTEFIPSACMCISTHLHIH